jgi:hypothetical protein
MTRGVSDSTGSFTFLVRWLKAWLEHGIELGVVLDAHPRPRDGVSACSRHTTSSSPAITRVGHVTAPGSDGARDG